MRTDAHQHFWRLGRFDLAWLDPPAMAPIRSDFLPADLRPLLDAAGIDRCVFVQTQHDVEETRWALRMADEHNWIAGVVGWVDLAGPGCEDQLLEMKAHPRFVGVRHLVQDEPDDDFIVREDVLRGLKVLERHGVPFDLLFHVRHLKHAPALAAHLPGLKLAINHLAKPRIKEGPIGDWRRDLRAAARCPNVCCKLSGLITEADWRAWTVADLRPYVQEALDCFGPGRCMFGSDWPVCLLAAPYERVHGALEAALGPLGEGERAAIFGGTAAEFYGLQSR